MEQIHMEAQLRQVIGGKKGLSVMRQSGSVPAVIYGTGKPSAHLTVGEKELLAVLKKGANAIVKVKYDKSEDTALLKDVQRHVVTGKIIHVDFQRISLTDKLKVKVRVKLVGEARGVKIEGGLVEHNMRELHVLCLPTEIPHEIEINIADLGLNEAIRIKDVKCAKAEIMEDPEHIVVSVAAPKEEKTETPAAAAGAAAAEPEVIAKGKKEEGEAAAGAEAAKPEEKKPAAPKK